ncbi:unnamed protein product [Prorocentrum cordatum]|uniref:PARP-type domain-containing protein n=1 Tax=Prorocentrum cordatum TaxID=2364126 RepID=A0ABN9QW64_9DINO|nr:unnamed protein product [Polarella glacialis]
MDAPVGSLLQQMSAAAPPRVSTPPKRVEVRKQRSLFEFSAVASADRAGQLDDAKEEPPKGPEEPPEELGVAPEELGVAPEEPGKLAEELGVAPEEAAEVAAHGASRAGKAKRPPKKTRARAAKADAGPAPEEHDWPWEWGPKPEHLDEGGDRSGAAAPAAEKKRGKKRRASEGAEGWPTDADGDGADAGDAGTGGDDGAEGADYGVPTEPAEVQPPSAAAPGQRATDAVPRFDRNPVCAKCKKPVEPLAARLVGKKKNVWQCSTRSSRHTQLHRIFGGWPPQSFKSLSQEEKDKIWNDVKEANGKAEVEKIAMETQRKYLPLSVYKKKGYSAKRIKRLCEDKKEDEVPGTLYCVNIDYKGDKSVEEEVRESLIAAKERSASSQQHQGKNKGKGKGKEQLSPTSATKKMMSDAVKILAKVSPLAFKAKGLLNSPRASKLHKGHSKALAWHVKDLDALAAAAQDALSKNAVLSIQLATVKEKADAAEKKCAQAETALSTFDD